jgi:SAM-dependent methyltransferase
MAESLPFGDGTFDAAMTTFSVHQWQDLEAGLREMRRVTRGPVVILSCDPALVEAFWLVDYAPDVLATEARRYPSAARIATVVTGTFLLMILLAHVPTWPRRRWQLPSRSSPHAGRCSTILASVTPGNVRWTASSPRVTDRTLATPTQMCTALPSRRRPPRSAPPPRPGGRMLKASR